MGWRGALGLDRPEIHPEWWEYTAEMVSTTVFSLLFCSLVGGPQWTILAIMSQAFLAWTRPRRSEGLLTKILRGFAVGLFWAGGVAVGKRLGIM